MKTIDDDATIDELLDAFSADDDSSSAWTPRGFADQLIEDESEEHAADLLPPEILFAKAASR